MFCQGRFNLCEADRLTMRDLDHGDARGLRVHRARGQLTFRCRLDPQCQRVDPRKGAIGKGHDLVAGAHGGEHHVQRGPAGPGGTEGVNVFRPPDFAQHVLALHHAAQNVRLHVVGNAGGGEPCQHAGIGIAWTRAGCQCFGDFQLRKDVDCHRGPPFCSKLLPKRPELAKLHNVGYSCFWQLNGWEITYP